MSGIRVLPTELKNKIAAGEVVERPASVVKELLENSLDAESTAITVEVLKGGRKLIKVSDNGSGMDREDAILSLRRHATSKLSSETDLFHITTMGFRGEALPSIASISRMTLSTALRGEPAGITLTAEGGEVEDVRESPAAGTVVEVRDLFYNTPARKKFLKRDSTELTHIVDIVTRVALSHPGSGFRLMAEGQETMNLPRASGLRERLMQVYGGEFIEGLKEAGLEAEGLKLGAFVSAPGNFRDTRTHQHVFINRRTVKEPFVSHAVYGAFEGILPRDKHPMFFVYLEVDPSLVDFNVHPAKREVRFTDREFVYRHVRRSIANAIRPMQGEAPSGPSFSPSYAPPSHTPSPGEEYRPAAAGGEPPAGVAEALSLSYRPELPFIYLGDTFVALSEGGGLTLLDHHAAHERVLYERLLKGIELRSHRLLFPRQVKLSRKEYMVILEHREMLFQFGMEVEDFGHDTVVIRSLPEAMEEADLRGILADAAQALAEGGRPGQALREAVAARIACHSSIRGSVVLSREGLNALLSDLEKTEDPLHCPHGRPTKVHYSLDGLKKIFKRK